MNKNLVELMASKFSSQWDNPNFPPQVKADQRRLAEKMLSVVKEHIGEVAEVCKACNGSGASFEFDAETNTPSRGTCSKCLGKRLIARTEGADHE